MKRKEAKTSVIYFTEEGAKAFQEAIKSRGEELYNKRRIDLLKLKEELTVPILYGSRENRENREGNGILDQLKERFINPLTPDQCLKLKKMEIIRAGNFVLGCSKEIKDEIEDAAIKRWLNSTVLNEAQNSQVSSMKEIKEIPSNKVYYDITYEKLEKLFEEIKVKVSGI